MHNPPLTHILVHYTKLLLRPEPTLEEIHARKGDIVKYNVIILAMQDGQIKETGHEDMITQRPSPFSFTRPRGTPDYQGNRSIYILTDTLRPLRQNARKVPTIVDRLVDRRDCRKVMLGYASNLIEARDVKEGIQRSNVSKKLPITSAMIANKPY